MSVPSVTDYVDQLRQSGTLNATQLAEVAGDLRNRFPDPKALAQELVRRRWVTVDQAKAAYRAAAARPVVPNGAPAAPVVAAAPPAADMLASPSGGRKGLLLGGLAALVLAAAVILAIVFWPRPENKTEVGKGGPPPDDEPVRQKRPATRVDPDDTPPPKAERLKWGKPAHASFSPRWLDKFNGEDIPKLERFDWQPRGLVAVLGEHRLRGALVAVSPDGKTLVTFRGGGDGYLVRLGDPDTLRERKILAPGVNLNTLVFSPDGKTLAGNSPSGSVYLWDMATGELAGTLPGHANGHSIQLAFSPDGKRMVTGANDTVHLWDVSDPKNPKELRKLKADAGGPFAGIQSVAFAPDGGRVVAAGLTTGESGRLPLPMRVWDVDGKFLAAFGPRPEVGKNSYVHQVTFSPNGEHVLALHPDNAVHVWEPKKDGKDVRQFAAGARVYPPRTDRVISVSPPRLWDADTGTEVKEPLPALPGPPAFFPDNKRVAYTSANVTAHVADAQGKEARPPVGPLADATNLALSPDGRYLLVAGINTNGGWGLYLWSLETGKERPVPAGSYGCVGFTADGRSRFDAAGGSLKVFGVADDQPGGALPAVTYAYAGAVTSDGRYGVQTAQVPAGKLVTGQKAELFRLQVGELGTDKLVRDMYTDTPCIAVTLSPDGKKALTWDGGKTALWNLQSGKKLQEWNAPWGYFKPEPRVPSANDPWKKGEQPVPSVRTVWASADGSRRVDNFTPGKLTLRDMQTMKVLWEWQIPTSQAVAAYTMSPDGRYLITANIGGTVYIIRLPAAGDAT
jgi:WD40 repeat protein